MITHSPDPDQKTYQTPEVIIACEVSSRELQWWDEKRVVCPAHVGHRREYTEWEVVEIALIKHMRNRRVGLGTVRKVLAKWRRTGSIERARFIIVNGLSKGNITTANDETAAVKILRDIVGAAWLIDAGEKGRITRATLAQGLQRTDSGRRRADTYRGTSLSFSGDRIV